MGYILSKFRTKAKEETTMEKLERVDTEIKGLEEHIQMDRRREKKVWTTFLFATGFLYVSVAGVLHLFILPRQTYLDISKLALIWTAPVILIYSLQRWIPWYFNRSITENREKLKKLRESKKKLLDHVRENEPYNKAKTILEKYEGPQNVNQSKPATPIPTPRSSISSTSTPRQSIGSLGPTIPAKTFSPAGLNNSNQRLPLRNAGPQQFPVGRAPMANRGAFDRLLDFVVKDGPENRMALICRACATHNGLCLLEEFDYMGFRCYSCQAVNPPRKTRPSVAHLPTLAQNSADKIMSRVSSGESSSSRSSDDENNVSSSQPQKRPNPLPVEQRTSTRIPYTPKVEISKTETASPIVSGEAMVNKEEECGSDERHEEVAVKQTHENTTETADA